MISKIGIEEIPGRRCVHNNPVTAEVMQFYESDWACCEVDIKHYKNSRTAAFTYRNAIRKMNVGVIAMERDGRVFLVRTV